MGAIREFIGAQALVDWIGKTDDAYHYRIIDDTKEYELCCEYIPATASKSQAIRAGFKYKDTTDYVPNYASGSTYGSSVVITDFKVTKLEVTEADLFKFTYKCKKGGVAVTDSMSCPMPYTNGRLINDTYSAEYVPELTTIFKIGNLDLSDYCNKDNFTVSKSAVWQSAFTNLYGQTLKTYMGQTYKISCQLTDIPNALKEDIEGSCCAQTVNMTFGSTTATFNQPDVSFTLSYETTRGEKMWAINISSVCDLAPGGL